MDRLSALDASFLYGETPESPMHVAGLAIFDPPPADTNVFAAFRDHLKSRLHLVPFFERKLALAPIQLDHPVWVHDDNLDLDYHFRHVSLPKPGTREQLETLVARLHMILLDRRREEAKEKHARALDLLREDHMREIAKEERVTLAQSSSSATQPGRIFIGHGRSAVWLELKDFLKERLKLTPEEFNSVPVAGTTTTARLEEMLQRASFAFIIMTAEDEQPDGKRRPRENVVHEAGLFQGRLGFKRAIILLEEGCEQFSNIHGLGQIRFPKGNISSTFEEIRKVLEWEKQIK